MKSKNKILIKRNDDAICELVKRAEFSLPYVADAVAQFNELGIGPLSNDELPLVVSDPRKLYDNHIDNLVKLPELSGPFAVDRNQFLKGLKLPDPSTFYSSSATLKDKLAHYGPDISYYAIKGEHCEISQQSLKQFEINNSVFADSEEELRIISILDKILNDFKELDAEYFALTGKHPIREQVGISPVHNSKTVTNNFIKCIHPDGGGGGMYQDKTVCGFQPKYDLILQLKADLQSRLEVA